VASRKFEFKNERFVSSSYRHALQYNSYTVFDYISSRNKSTGTYTVLFRRLVRKFELIFHAEWTFL
jgi:hypothetical protein